MKLDVENVMNEADKVQSRIEEITIMIEDHEQNPYWCGYYDGFLGTGHYPSDLFSEDDPEYLMGIEDGKGDLEILSNRTPN